MSKRRGKTGVGVRRVALTAAMATAALWGASATAQADPLTKTSLSEAASMTWTGGVTGEQLGSVLRSAGDVNGDGRPDVIAKTSNSTNPGMYVLFTPPSLQGTYSVGVNGLSPTQGYRIRFVSGTANDIVDVGDQNGDGVPDQLLWANSTVWLVYGVKDPSTLPKCDPAATTRCLLVSAAITPAGGYQITNSTASGIGGVGITSAADFNGDGVQDIVLGSSSGQVSVLYGGRTVTTSPVDVGTLPASEALRIDAPESGDVHFGQVSNAGIKDLNGDGKDEIGIVSYAGTLPAAVYVIFGRSGAPSPMSTGSFSPSDGFRLGIFPLSNPVLQRVGDVNGDGRPDLTFFGGAQLGADAFAGGFVYTPAVNPSDPIPMPLLLPSQGYVFKPIDAAPMLVGGSLGDLNGDGVPDVVGGNKGFLLADGSTGFAQVVFGKRPTPAGPFNIGPEMTPDKGVALFDVADKQAGAGIVPVGDVDADGLPDFFVSAQQAPIGGATNFGIVSLVLGSSLVPIADTASVQQVTDSSAIVGGSVTVKKKGPVKAHVEYGPTTAYGATTEDVTVHIADRLSEEVSGLAASTTYHYRTVATNALGLTRYGQDRTFTTAPTPESIPPGPLRTGDLCTDYPVACTPPPPPHVTPKAAALTVSASPSSKAVKVGKSATFSVKVGNSGGTAASGVKVCAAVSSRVTLRKKCTTIGALAAGASKKVSFVAKGTKKAKGHAYKVTFKATGTRLASKSASAKISVR